MRQHLGDEIVRRHPFGPRGIIGIAPSRGKIEPVFAAIQDEQDGAELLRKLRPAFDARVRKNHGSVGITRRERYFRIAALDELGERSADRFRIGKRRHRHRLSVEKHPVGGAAQRQEDDDIATDVNVMSRGI